jgi:GntR family transcriptional regulator, transcriptional repressor for pyruvate dehydrogenase complex
VAQRTEKVAEAVARQILRDIQRHGLAPGSVLPAESAMVEQFGVGRGSVREALRILEVNGLVTLKPGPRGGPIVTPFDPANFGQILTLHLESIGATYRQMLEARVEYETVLARKAAEQAGDEAGKIVRESITKSPAAVADQATYVSATSHFHQAVGRASGNPVLALAADSIYAIWSVRVTEVLYPEQDRPIVHQQHEAITRAIERRDPKRSERLMREHMLEYLEYCEKRYPARMDDIVDWK